MFFHKVNYLVILISAANILLINGQGDTAFSDFSNKKFGNLLTTATLGLKNFGSGLQNGLKLFSTFTTSPQTSEFLNQAQQILQKLYSSGNFEQFEQTALKVAGTGYKAVSCFLNEQFDPLQKATHGIFQCVGVQTNGIEQILLGLVSQASHTSGVFGNLYNILLGCSMNPICTFNSVNNVSKDIFKSLKDIFKNSLQSVTLLGNSAMALPRCFTSNDFKVIATNLKDLADGTFTCVNADIRNAFPSAN